MVTAASRGLQYAISHCVGSRGRGCLRRALLRVDQVGDLEVQREVWLEVLRIASIYYRGLSVQQLPG